jgi:hypothetical protein
MRGRRLHLQRRELPRRLLQRPDLYLERQSDVPGVRHVGRGLPKLRRERHLFGGHVQLQQWLRPL